MGVVTGIDVRGLRKVKLRRIGHHVILGADNLCRHTRAISVNRQIAAATVCNVALCAADLDEARP
jgi:hypothetical protein